MATVRDPLDTRGYSNRTQTYMNETRDRNLAYGSAPRVERPSTPKWLWAVVALAALALLGLMLSRGRLHQLQGAPSMDRDTPTQPAQPNQPSNDWRGQPSNR